MKNHAGSDVAEHQLNVGTTTCGHVGGGGGSRGGGGFGGSRETPPQKNSLSGLAKLQTELKHFVDVFVDVLSTVLKLFDL